MFAQIDLDDLHDPENSAGIILEMQDRQRYFEGQMAGASAANAARKVKYYNNVSSVVLNVSHHQNLDIRAILQETKVNLHNWEVNLAQVRELPFYLWI